MKKTRGRPKKAQTTPAPVPPSPDSDWLTPAQAAAHIGVSLKVIYDACKFGGLKHTKLSDTSQGHIRIRRRWLEAWMEEHASVHTVRPWGQGGAR